MGVDALRRDPCDVGGGVLSPLLYLDNLIVDTPRWDPCDVGGGVLSPPLHLDNMILDAVRWDLCVRGGGYCRLCVLGVLGEGVLSPLLWVPIEDNVKKLCTAIDNFMMVGDKRKFYVAWVSTFPTAPPLLVDSSLQRFIWVWIWSSFITRISRPPDTRSACHTASSPESMKNDAAMLVYGEMVANRAACRLRSFHRPHP